MLVVVMGCLHPIEWDEDEWEKTSEQSTNVPTEPGNGEIPGKIKECLDLLGFSESEKETCNQDIVNKKFRRKARSVHPDKNNTKKAAEDYKILNNAKEILLKYCNYRDGKCSEEALNDLISKSPID